MSWDVYVADFPKAAKTLDQIPDGFSPRAVPRAELIEGVRDVVPEVNFSDPSWGIIKGPDYSIEVNCGNDDPINGFTLHVRGGGDVLQTVAAVIDRLGMRGIDVQSSTFFDLTAAEQSLSRWTEYRDRVLASYEQPAATDPPVMRAVEEPPEQKVGLLRRLFGRD